MEHEKLVALVEQLLVEVTVQRLVTRSLLISRMANSKASIAGLMDALEQATAMTSPDLFPLPGVEADLQRRASAIATERAEALLLTFGQALRRRRAA